MKDPSQRYHGAAICLHWIIAILIVAMLAIGNYMVSLEQSDPARFALTQWHKSFGVVALALILVRILWRLTHSPPALPGRMESWEKFAAALTHVALYLLILAIPLSGWIMVSASPLELPTVIFNKIGWPHLPPFDSLPDKRAVSELFAEVHALAGWLLILALVAHIGAALRHRFLLRDEVMARMSPRTTGGAWVDGVLPLGGAILLAVAGLLVYAFSGSNSPPLGAGNSDVRFSFTLQNQQVEGRFPDSSVEMLLDAGNPAANRLRATVNVATVNSGNSQIDSTLVGGDWFDAENHAQAIFESRALLPDGEDRYSATGSLTIRGVHRELTFPVKLVSREDRRFAGGGFTVNRLDFDLGRESQPDEDTVAYRVDVIFEFEVR